MRSDCWVQALSIGMAFMLFALLTFGEFYYWHFVFTGTMSRSSAGDVALLLFLCNVTLCLGFWMTATAIATVCVGAMFDENMKPLNKEEPRGKV